MEAYLDIETTGLSPFADAITVVGVYRRYADGYRMTQLVGPNITRAAVEGLLEGVDTLYTYNGIRFDAVFLETRLQVEFPRSLTHKDLMHDCWRRGLYGGLKSVERQLGIERRLLGVAGREAVDLWWRYIRKGDSTALDTLLRYNEEDVLNLKILRERLSVD